MILHGWYLYSSIGVNNAAVDTRIVLACHPAALLKLLQQLERHQYVPVRGVKAGG